ncbi:hypothetical protein [Nostoc sp.]
MASSALLSPALNTCSAVSCNSGKIVEAIALFPANLVSSTAPTIQYTSS